MGSASSRESLFRKLQNRKNKKIYSRNFIKVSSAELVNQQTFIFHIRAFKLNESFTVSLVDKRYFYWKNEKEDEDYQELRTLFKGS